MARDIRELLHDAAPSRRSARTFEDVWQRSRALRIRKMVASGVGTVAIVFLATVLVTRADDGPTTLPPSDHRTTGTGDATIDVGGSPSQLDVGDGSVWVAVTDDDTGKSIVKRIDPSTNRVIAEVPLVGSGADPDNTDGLVATDDDVWVVTSRLPAHEGSVYRIDTATNEIVGEPFDFEGRPVFGLAVGAGSVWVTTSGRGLIRIDAETGLVVHTLPLRKPDIAVLDGTVWVGHGSGRISPIDLATNRVVLISSLEVAARIYELTADDDYIWATTSIGLTGRGVTRIDPVTRATKRVAVELFPAFPTVEGDYLWAVQLAGPKRERGLQGTIVRVDRDSVRLVGEPIQTDAGGPWFTVGFGSIWIDAPPGDVRRIPAG